MNAPYAIEEGMSYLGLQIIYLHPYLLDTISAPICILRSTDYSASSFAAKVEA